MGKTYALLHKKVQRLESQLLPIISSPPDPQTAPLHQPVTDEVNQELHFIENLISAERASVPAPAHPKAHYRLRKMARRVRLLQTSLRDWAEARPAPPYNVEDGSGPTCCSTTESCLDDDDDDDGNREHDVGDEEEFSVAGFRVYENPEFVSEDDDDDDVQVKVEDYYEMVKQDNEDEDEDEDEDDKAIELFRKGDEMEARSEEEEEDDGDEGTRENCCYRIVFGVIMVVMGVTFVLVGFPDYADHHPSSSVLLVPT